MTGLRTLFDEMTLVIVRGPARSGGQRLPADAQVVALRRLPTGILQRRLGLLGNLPVYLGQMLGAIARADVVHTPLPGDISFLAMLLARLLDKRLIVRYCTSWASAANQTLMKRLMRTLVERQAGGRCVALATGCGVAPPAPRMHWLFATAITENEVAAVRPQLDRSCQSPPRLALVGRLTAVKGVDRLIEAMGLLQGTLDDSHLPHLVIVGDGPLRRELESLAVKRGCDKRIRFTGQLGRSELVEQLLEADLCVQPSHSEGFCKALLDAMLCGVPVLATGVGANRQIIGDDGQRGWVLPSTEPAVIAQEIRLRLSEPNDWPAMRRRCRQYVEQHTLETWSRRIADLCAEQWNLPLPAKEVHA